MPKNLGNLDRALRVVGALILGGCFYMAPFGLGIRSLFLGQAVYFAVTALAGTCLGYKLLGLSTCPVDLKSNSFRKGA